MGVSQTIFLRNITDTHLVTAFYRNTINSIIDENDTVIWMGTGGGLMRFNLSNKSIKCFYF